MTCGFGYLQNLLGCRILVVAYGQTPYLYCGVGRSGLGTSNILLQCVTL